MMYNRLTKPDAEQSKTKQGYFQLYGALKHYFWICPESKYLLFFYLFFQSLVLVSFMFEDSLYKLWKGDESVAQVVSKGFQYFNFQRFIAQQSDPLLFSIIFYLSILLGLILNMLLPLGLLMKNSLVLQTLNEKVWGRAYLWCSIFGYYFFGDIYLMPFKPMSDTICSLSGSCLDAYGHDAMKILGILLFFYWFVQTIAILTLSENSRISKGRYFIRYDYNVEILVLSATLINRIGTNLLENKYIQIRCFVNFALYLILLFEVRQGRGIVHPLTRKYFVLFCILPMWLAISQVVAIATGSAIQNLFRIAIISAILFLPILIFKTDDLDLVLLAIFVHEP